MSEFIVLPLDAGEIARRRGVNQPSGINGHHPIDEPAGWERIDLNNPDYAIPPDPPSIVGLLYDGKRHVISGAPESAKTLVAYLAGLETIRAGDTIAILDFEMGPGGAWRLLTDIGATPEEIDRIYFVSPDTPPTDELQAVIRHQPRLVIIDAAAGAYDVTGLDDNARKDAEAFARQWIRPLWQVSIATVLIDHVVKNTDTRGKFAIGSERKVGQADVHLGLEAVKSLSRGGSGLLKVHVHKDRPGFLTRPYATAIELESHHDSHHVTWTFVNATDTDDETGEFRPTFQMERVSRYLEEQPEPVSRTNVETTVKGKSAKAIRQALDALLREQFIVEIPGPRNARMVSSITSYRQSEDPKHTTPSDPVSPRPDGVTLTPSDAVPPTGTRTGSGRTQTTSPRPEEPDDQDRAFIASLEEQARSGKGYEWEHEQ